MTARWYCSQCLNSFSEERAECPNLSCQILRPLEGWEKILQPKQIFDRRFRIYQLLAVGGAGITYLSKETNEDGADIGPLLAIKVLFTGRDSGGYLHRLSNEAQILEHLAHPHIIEYLGFSYISGHSPYLITRYATGGSLMDHLKENGAIKSNDIFIVGSQICSALKQAHQRGIIHRDLKPENILLSEKTGEDGPFHALLADFGIAKTESSSNYNLTRTGTFVGTPNFAAPEQFLAKGVTKSIDVYSTCALLYYALTGRFIFTFSRSISHEEIMENLHRNLPPPPITIECSNSERIILDEIFSGGLQFDPKDRISLNELHILLDKGISINFSRQVNLSKGIKIGKESKPIVEIISNKTSGELSFVKNDFTPTIALNLKKERLRKSDKPEGGMPSDQSSSMENTATPKFSPTELEGQQQEEEHSVLLNDSLSELISDDTFPDFKLPPDEPDDTLNIEELLQPLPEKKKGFLLPLTIAGIGLLGLLLGIRIVVSAQFVSTDKDDEITQNQASVSPIKLIEEGEAIARRWVGLTEGIQQRCQIPEKRAIEMTLRIDGNGQVLDRLSVKASPDINIECVYTILSQNPVKRLYSVETQVVFSARW